MTWHLHVCDVTHSYIWCESLIYVRYLIHILWHNSLISCDMTHSYNMACLINVCDMTHSYIRFDELMYMTWLVYKYDMTHWCMWDDSFIYMTWLMDVYDMTHSYIWHDSLMHVTWLHEVGRYLQSRIRRHVPKDPFLICCCVPHKYEEALSYNPMPTIAIFFTL